METNCVLKQSLTHSLTHPAYLMPREPKLSLWNVCAEAYYRWDGVLEGHTVGQESWISFLSSMPIAGHPK